MSDFLSFHLSREFVDSYRDRPIPWGFVDAHGTSVSEITYLRTYSRVKEDGSKETWTDTVERVINGTFSIQKDHAKQNRLPWSDVKAQRSAERMFHDLWNFRWSPPGRGLFAMGSPRVHGERGSSTALNNCSVVSSNLMTKNDPAKPFVKLMDNSMLGVGVGFDTDGYKKGFRVHRPEESNEVFVVPDTREGWSESVGLLINAYLKPNQSLPTFDYSQIRAAGEPIKTFGGIAPGPDPLIQLHERLIRVFEEKVGQDADSMLILDIANIIGVGVVSGGVRRCMPQGTMVHTSRGLVPIESVEVGDEVVTYGAPSKVLANMDQGVQRTNVVRTEIGQLEATPNHRVATVKSIYGDVEWKRVDELTPGDKLIFPRKVAPGRRTHFPPFSYMKPENSTTCVDITVPELDTDSAWLLGLFLGDGYVYPNFKNNGRNGYVSIACDPGNREVVERAVAQLERFGVKATPKEGFKDDRCVKITAISKQLAWYLSQFKTANETISVPDFIKESTPEIRAAFLAGVLDSDGALNNKPVVACASVYPEFLKELQDLYASLGIPTVIKLNRPAKGTWQDLYHLNLKGSHPMEDLVRYILPHSNKELTRERGKEQFYYGFNRDMVLQNLRYKDFQGVWTPNTKQMTVTAAARVLNREVEWYPIEVVSIEEGRTVQTYDIEVQDEHNFIAHGYVVHNSALLAAGDPDDMDFISAKDLEKNPNRSEWFFMSNNSIKVNTGDDLSHILDDIKMIGEPGVLWLDVAHNYGRIEDGIRTDDQKTVATNPCLGSETVFITRDGDRKLGDMVGESVEVWAHGWHPATVESFGLQQLNRVSFNNDTTIRVTPNHRWELVDGTLTHDLKVGDRVPATSPYDEPLPEYWEVTSIEPDGVEEVFCAVVPGKERFTLAGGIYTSNCGEIFLEGGGELCCLSDVYIGRQESKEEFFRSLKNAYLYAKTVTLLPTEDPDTNAIIQRNRRIGVSLSGVADFADNEGLPKLREWMDDGYKYLKGLDKKYSEWLCVRESIRLTTSKPGGTTGIVFGQSPGVHWSPGGKTFLRGIIFQKNDPIVAQLEAAGYTVEESAYTPETSVFVQFPVKSQAKRSESEVSFFEKANLAATAQRYWADNSVSVTLSFDRDTEGDQLPLVLQMFEGQLKSASFLPMGKETYLQMPYQSMTQSEYDEVEGTCLPVDLGPVYRGNALEAVGDNYCTTSSCEIRAVTEANES